MFRLVETAEGRAVVERLFDAWLNLLIGTLPKAPVPTRCSSVQVGETIETTPQMPIRAAAKLAWIAPPAAPLVYVGLETRGVPCECWPITDQAWALCDNQKLRVWRSAELLAANGSAAFADGFHAFAVSLVAHKRASLAARRIQRDLLSRDAERSFVATSLARLASVGRGERLAAEYGGTEPLEQACRMIAGWLGIDPPQVGRPAGPALSQLQAALARTTGMRMRGVLLEHDWYANDGGPLSVS